MEKIITYDSFNNFTYSNDKLCSSDIRGIVLNFSGLGFQSMYSEDGDTSRRYAELGIIYLTPYMNPWAWMNRQTVDFTDELIDVICDRYSLSDNIPIVSSGGSMGGQQALVYMAYAKRTPKTCVVNCPVCDLPYHYSERPDLPRTLYSAFGSYDMSLQEAMESASPLHLVNRFPDSDYYVFHCERDTAVNKEKHSDKLVAELSKNHRVKYHTIPERGHCDLTPEMWELYFKYSWDSIIL